MKRIEKLTTEQIALMTTIRDEWISKLETLKFDKQKAKEGIEWLYEFTGLKKPAILFLSSPLACQFAANILGGTTANVGDNVRANVRANVGANVRANVGANVGDNVWDNVWDNVRDMKLKFYEFASHGSIWDYNWLAFYSYFERIGMDLKNKDFYKFRDLINSGIYDMVQLDGLCIVSKLPDQIHRIESNGRKVLHADGKPAIEWDDGYKLWFLNGINVPQILAETPAHELTLDYYKELSSADHRIEFVAKYGVERIKFLGKVLDTYENYRNHEYWDRYIFGKSKYELIDMSDCYNGDKEAIFLGMVHQGNGMYIMECVGSGVRTIKQALESRIEESLDDYECTGFH